MDVLLRQIGVVYLHVELVPGQPLTGQYGDVSQVKRLRYRAFEFEIAARPDLASFAGIEPFPLVTGGSGQSFGRLLEDVHFRLLNQSWIFSVEAAQDFASVPYEKEPFVFISLAPERTIGLEFLRSRRLQSSVIPGEFHRRHVAASWEVVMNDGGKRIRLLVAIRGTRFDAQRRFQLHHAEYGVVAVAAHIAQRATPEVGPSAPQERQVSVVKRTFRSRAEPQIPIQSFWHPLRFFGAFHTLRPKWPAGPIDHLPHRTDGTAPD